MRLSLRAKHFTGHQCAGPGNYQNETPQFIQPGQIGSIGLYSVGPETVRAEATIAGVVFEDQTWEGAAAQMFFTTRATRAKETRQALAQMQSYPATPGEMRERMKALLSLGAANISGAVANNLHLNVIPDADHAPEAASRHDWEGIKTQLEREAEWYEAHGPKEGAEQ